MPLFHLFTVKPVEVQDHELPRVQYGDYYLFAANLQAAWAKIMEWDGVADAAEVWGTEAGQHFEITPSSQLHRQEQASQHRHWSHVQDRYRLIHTGQESLEQWADRRLDERVRARTAAAAEQRRAWNELRLQGLRTQITTLQGGTEEDQERAHELSLEADELQHYMGLASMDQA